MKIIDTHIHGGYGVNFNTSSKKNIKYLLKKLHDRGIVAICPTLTGDSEENLYNRLKLLKELKTEHCENESYIIGAHLEGTFLNPDKPGIQDKGSFLLPDIKNFKNIVRNLEDIIKIVTLAPELDTRGELAKYLESKNIRAHAGHTKADNIGFCTGTTHHFNAMPPLSHRGQNLALDALFNNNIFCEIIADGLHVKDNMIKLFFKIKDISRIIAVSDALPSSHAENEITFCGKTINKTGKDANGTIAGSVMFLDEILDRCIKNDIFDSVVAKLIVYDNILEHLNLDKNEMKIIDKN